jgi:hypothetical protein
MQRRRVREIGKQVELQEKVNELYEWVSRTHELNKDDYLEIHMECPFIPDKDCDLLTAMQYIKTEKHLERYSRRLSKLMVVILRQMQLDGQQKPGPFFLDLLKRLEMRWGKEWPQADWIGLSKQVAFELEEARPRKYKNIAKYTDESMRNSGSTKVGTITSAGKRSKILSMNGTGKNQLNGSILSQSIDVEGQ